MTKQRQQALQRLVRELRKAAAIADEHEVELPNGALVGAHLATLAADVELQLPRQRFEEVRS